MNGPEDEAPPRRPRRFNELELLLAATEDLEKGLLVDVGAHIGSFSEAFARRDWEVVAIEAAPEIYAELAARMGEHPNVTTIHAAATEEGGGTADFYISSEYWGIHSLRPFHESHDSTVRVPTVRVGDIVSDHDSKLPYVLKIDTEGADLFVLRGVDWEAHPPRLVMCEFMDERTLPHFGYSYTDMVTFMEDRGYLGYASEWAPVKEHSRRGTGGGPFTHIQVLRLPLQHSPSWGNLLFVLPQDMGMFEERLTRYLTLLAEDTDQKLDAAWSVADRLSHVEAALSNRARKIDGLEKTQQRLVQEKGEAVQRRDARIAELDAAVRRRDARIADLGGAVGSRDARIAELQGAVRGRDGRIGELKEAVGGRDTRIEELEQTINALREQLDQRADELAVSRTLSRRWRLLAIGAAGLALAMLLRLLM